MLECSLLLPCRELPAVQGFLVWGCEPEPPPAPAGAGRAPPGCRGDAVGLNGAVLVLPLCWRGDSRQRGCGTGGPWPRGLSCWEPARGGGAAWQLACGGRGVFGGILVSCLAVALPEQLLLCRTWFELLPLRLLSRRGMLDAFILQPLLVFGAGRAWL